MRTAGMLTLLVALLLSAMAGASMRPALADSSNPSAPESRAPHLAKTDDEQVVMSWLEPAGADFALRFSTLYEGTWSAPITVARGNNWFVNWADFPSVVPIKDDFWAAHWLVKRPGGQYAYDIYVSLSDDAGRNWRPPVMLHDDNTATEHGFVTLFAAADQVGAVWLDGRQTTGGGHSHGNHSSGHGAMSLRTARIARDGSVIAGKALDTRVCDCCPTDVAITASGPLAVYRNRTSAEIRDIYAIRQLDGKWHAGERVSNDGWEIDGCPVNGPTIDARDETVVGAWFTGADNKPRVLLGWSRDAGATFDAPVVIDDMQPVGHVDVALLQDGRALVSWLRSRAEGGLAMRTVSADGSLGATEVIDGVVATRATGIPQLIVHDDQILLAWTDRSGEQSRVRTVLVDQSAIGVPE